MVRCIIIIFLHGSHASPMWILCLRPFALFCVSGHGDAFSYIYYILIYTWYNTSKPPVTSWAISLWKNWRPKKLTICSLLSWGVRNQKWSPREVHSFTMGGWSDFTLAIKYIFSGWWITLQWRQRMHGAPSAPIEPHAERQQPTTVLVALVAFWIPRRLSTMHGQW